jgi:GT2 family glycosyltransferase
MTSVSVISVTYNTGPVLFDMVQSVLAQQGLTELILVDNGNPVEVRQRLEGWRKKDPRLILITGHGNVGFATANNMGAKRAVAPYLLFLNPDCVLGDNFLEAMVSQSNNLPRPHLLSCRILDGDGKEQSGSRRDILTPMNALVEAFGLYRFSKKLAAYRFKQHDNALPRDVVEVPAISGAVMLMRVEDYWAVGGLDSDYFLHVEDLDLCLSIARAGGKVYFTPHINVMHLGATSETPSGFVEWQKARSFIRYFHKNFSKEYALPFLWLVDAGILARFLVRYGLNKAKSA